MCEGTYLYKRLPFDSVPRYPALFYKETTSSNETDQEYIQSWDMKIMQMIIIFIITILVIRSHFGSSHFGSSFRPHKAGTKGSWGMRWLCFQRRSERWGKRSPCYARYRECRGSAASCEPAEFVDVDGRPAKEGPTRGSRVDIDDGAFGVDVDVDREPARGSQDRRAQGCARASRDRSARGGGC